jgi:hypothetical protein
MTNRRDRADQYRGVLVTATVSNGPLTNASGGTITPIGAAVHGRDGAAHQPGCTVNQPLTLNAVNGAHSGTIDATATTVSQSGASRASPRGTDVGAGRTLFLTGGA